MFEAPRRRVDAGVQWEVARHERGRSQVDDEGDQDAEELREDVEPAALEPLFECWAVGEVGGAELGEVGAESRAFAWGGWVVSGRKEGREAAAETGEAGGLGGFTWFEGLNSFRVASWQCREFV